MVNTFHTQPTINKIVGIFQDIANRHLMIKTYGHGPDYNIGSSSSVVYPLLWTDSLSSSLEVSTNSLIKTFEFEVFVMDRIDKGDSNFIETVSDTDYILNTIVTELSRDPIFIDLRLSINGNLSFDRVVDGGNDNVNGWKTTIQFRTFLPYSNCNIPIDAC